MEREWERNEGKWERKERERRGQCRCEAGGLRSPGIMELWGPASPMPAPHSPPAAPQTVPAPSHSTAAAGARGTTQLGSAAGVQGSPPSWEGPCSPALPSGARAAASAAARDPRSPRWQEPPRPSPCPAGTPQQSPWGPKRWLPSQCCIYPICPTATEGMGRLNPSQGLCGANLAARPADPPDPLPLHGGASPCAAGESSRKGPGVPAGLTREQRDTGVFDRSRGL